MLVFFEEKLTILAMPKTGSTALHMALASHASMSLRNPPSLKHAPVRKYQRILLPTIQKLGGPADIETFALIRHPAEWLSSWFRYRCRDQLVGQLKSTRNVTFDQFVLETLRDDPAPFAKVGVQSRFLSNPDGKMSVDHLFRYEATGAYTAFLTARLGREIETKRRNASPDFAVKLAPSVRTALEKEREVDFDLWEQAQH